MCNTEYVATLCNNLHGVLIHKNIKSICCIPETINQLYFSKKETVKMIHLNIPVMSASLKHLKYLTAN